MIEKRDILTCKLFNWCTLVGIKLRIENVYDVCSIQQAPLKAKKGKINGMAANHNKRRLRIYTKVLVHRG
jgi:hypothetical protein